MLLTRRALLVGAAALACARGPGAITDERVAATHNNFYELTSGKDAWRHVDRFNTDGWTVEVTGLVSKPRTYSIDELRRLPHEERIYRHRCVEAWSMVVPWSGFPLRKLLLAAEPTHAAKYVKFVSAHIKQDPSQPWPYVEGLRIDEAMHDLTLVVTGIYGHPLPKQHGAPVRVVVPWKYGYKSPKSIVRIELTAERPRTFWETLAPVEYPFESNVDPTRPHPRWSQATERLIGTWDVRRTLAFNGYGEQVRGLYV